MLLASGESEVWTPLPFPFLLLLLTAVPLALCDTSWTRLTRQHCRLQEHDLVESCLRKLVDDVTPFLRKGFKEDGIPSLDPSTLDEVRVHETNQIFNVTAVLSEVVLRGFSTAKTTQIKYDDATRNVSWNLRVPLIKLNGQYANEGHFLTMWMHAKGNFKGELRNVSGVGFGKLATADSEGVIQFEEFDFRTSTEDAWFQFEWRSGLFNSFIGTLMTRYINRHWQVFVSRIQPQVNALLNHRLKEIVNTALRSLS